MTHSDDTPRTQRRAHHHDQVRDPARFRRGSGPDGFGPPFGPGRRRGKSGGRERGDVRTAVLVLLREQPRHGYDLMREIGERTNGAWAPSPGSIYPTLQALEDEGLISFATIDGRKTASLTDAGRAWTADHADEAAAVFSKGGGRPAEMLAMREEVHGLHDAIMAVGRTRDVAVATEATAILAAARKDIYRLLADR